MIAFWPSSSRSLARPQGAHAQGITRCACNTPIRPLRLPVCDARRHRCIRDARLTVPPRQSSYTSPHLPTQTPPATMTIWEPSITTDYTVPHNPSQGRYRAFPERHRERISIGPSRRRRNFAQGRTESDAVREATNNSSPQAGRRQRGGTRKLGQQRQGYCRARIQQGSHAEQA